MNENNIKNGNENKVLENIEHLLFENNELVKSLIIDSKITLKDNNPAQLNFTSSVMCNDQISGFDVKFTEEEEYFTPLDGLDITPYLYTENKQGMYHLSRYHWVKEVLKTYKSKKILDIACGAGYGSFIIANHLSNSSVIGADYDQRAIALSKGMYARKNLDYVCGDMVSWTKIENGQRTPLGTYDAIVCFDTIEHIAHREIALMRIAENLNEGGVLAVSTPIRSQNLLNPPWKEHKIEYCSPDLKKFLSSFFKKVLVSEENTLPNIQYFRDVINKDKLRYNTSSNPIICIDPI